MCCTTLRIHHDDTPYFGRAVSRQEYQQISSLCCHNHCRRHLPFPAWFHHRCCYGKIQELVKRTNYAYEYVKFMNYPPAIAKVIHPVEDGPHTIEFKNVSFTYPNTDVKVLDGVNLTLYPGEYLSIVGFQHKRL